MDQDPTCKGVEQRSPKKTKRPKLDPLVPEKLSAASFERRWCAEQCKLCFGCKTPFLRPFVPRGWTRKLLLVGEAPGGDEDTRTGRPFTGRAGRLLRRLYRTAGYRDIDVALVNAVRCRPAGNATPSMSQVRACRGFLLRTIIVLNPARILGLGVVAARALTNTGDVSVTGLRGRQLEVPGVEPAGLVVYCTYHPAAVLHGATHLAKRIVEDLRRFDAAPRALPAGELPQDLHTLGVDLEWSADGELLTIGLADEKHAYAFDAG